MRINRRAQCGYQVTLRPAGAPWPGRTSYERGILVPAHKR